MGSAEGRRLCWKNFWDRGYAIGARGDHGYDERSLRHAAYTVSKGFQNYFIQGYEWGCADRLSGVRRTYQQFRESKEPTKEVK